MSALAPAARPASYVCLVAAKQVRETWRLIKNRFYAEKEFRQNASNMGKDIPGDFPYYDDCAFLEGGKPEVHNFG